MPKTAYKFKNRKCCICGSNETYIKNTGEPWWIRYKINGNWDRKSHLCMKCHIKERSPDCKNRQFRITHSYGKGIIGEAVVMDVRKIKNYNIEVNNFCAKFDLFGDPEYDVIQVKTKIPFYGDWTTNFGEEHNFNTLFFLCMNENRKVIERIYIIPEKELCDITGVSVKYNGKSKWEKFRLNDIELYNDAYQSLIEYLKDKKFFNFNDIENWLKRRRLYNVK